MTQENQDPYMQLFNQEIGGAIEEVKKKAEKPEEEPIDEEIEKQRKKINDSLT